jgi:SAM-dependent methyltransferase
LAKLLIRLGKLLQSSAVAVMRPDDLIKFSRQYYAKESSVENWSDDQNVDIGLYPHEKELLEKINPRGWRLLLLGLGGGREAIPLARMGYDITGIDFIPQMVQQTIKNAEKRGVKIRGLVQDISRLDVPQNHFDIAWLPAPNYSCVPTKKRRVAMLKKISNSLKPGGFLILGFFWNPHLNYQSKISRIQKVLARLTLGNQEFEPGDTLRLNREFIHEFHSIDKLRSEILAAGFTAVEFQISEERIFAEAILQKPLQ